MKGVSSSKRQRIGNKTIADIFYVTILVRGVAFSLPSSCLSKFPRSFFGTALEWNKKNKGNSNQLVIDDRDAELFYHVAEYLRHGCLPRDKKGDCLIDRKLLPELLIEADYFMLPELKREINDRMSFDVPHLNDTKRFLDMASLIQKEAKFGEFLYDCKEVTSTEPMKLQAYQMQCSYQCPDSVCYGKLPDCSEDFLSLESTSGRSAFSLNKLTKVEILLNMCGNKDTYSDAQVTSQAIEHLIYTTVCPSIGFLSGYYSIELQRFDINSKMDRKTKFSKLSSDIKMQAVGTVVVCIPSQLHGGCLYVEDKGMKEFYECHSDFGTYVAYRNDCCTCALEPVTSGLQILLTFTIYENNYYAERLLRDASAVTLKALEQYHNQAVNYQQLYSNIEKFLTHFPSLGYFTKEDYSDCGFTVSALTGVDKLLHDTLTTKGIVISLVHVVCCLEVYFDDSCERVFKNIVTLLDDRCLLPQHKNLATTCYFIGKRHDGKPFVWSAGIGNKEVDYCHKTITIRTAFVMSLN